MIGEILVEHRFQSTGVPSTVTRAFYFRNKAMWAGHYLSAQADCAAGLNLFGGYRKTGRQPLRKYAQ